MGKKKGQKRAPGDPGGSLPPQQGEPPGQAGPSDQPMSQQQSAARAQPRGPRSEPHRQGSLEQRSGQNQDPPVQSRPLEPPVRPPPASTQTKQTKQAAQQAWSKKSEPSVQQSPTAAGGPLPQLSASMQPPAAHPAETKNKGISRSGGQIAQPTSETPTPEKAEPSTVETTFDKSTKKQKRKDREAQKPTASAAPLPLPSGVVDDITEGTEKLLLKTKPEQPSQQQPAGAWGKKSEPPSQQPASAWGKKSEPPAQQPTSAWGKKLEPSMRQPAAPWDKTADRLRHPPASMQPSAAQSAETKNKGKGRRGGQSALQTTATITPEKVQSSSVETKPGKEKQTGKDQEAQKPAASASPGQTVSEAGNAQSEDKVYKLPQRQGPEFKEHKTIEHQRSGIERRLTIEVNYLPLKLTKPQLRIYRYAVNFISKKPKRDDKKSVPNKPNRDNRKSVPSKPNSDNEKPKFPRSLLRNIMKQMRSQCFNDRYPAFDGVANMYVAGQPLQKSEIRDDVTIRSESGKDETFDVTITLANSDLNIKSLLDYCKNGITSNMPQNEIQATDIAFGSNLTNFTQVGRSFFTPPSRNDHVDLTGGMELWSGCFQSAIFAWEPYLNIDVANKAFPIEQPVLDFLIIDMKLKENTLRNGLRPSEFWKLEKFIKGLKISYKMPVPGRAAQHRTHRVIGLAENALNEKFEFNGRKICVGEYYDREKKSPIKYLRLPLLKINNKGNVVPIEMCSIIGNQVVTRKLNEMQKSKMVRAAAQSTIIRKRRIQRNIAIANHAANPTLKEFGIEVSQDIQKVNAVVLKAPAIAYEKGEAKVTNGAWKLEKNNFKQSSTIPRWGVLNLEQGLAGSINYFVKLIKDTGLSLGMKFPEPAQPFVTHTDEYPSEKNIKDYLNEFGAKGVAFVFVVLPFKGDNYGEVKRASEWHTGVLTQCIKSKTLENLKFTTVSNILLKVNSKLQGVNHSLAEKSKPQILKGAFMLVGADVTHPGREDCKPSIAAVAASHDDFGFQYNMKYRLQPSNQEMITELAEMMKAHIKFYEEKNGRKPEQIFYFRDGVSEGQFQEILNVELTAIKTACHQLNPNYEATVTFIVVQKRHHTRFFPREADGDVKNCNVPAGTLVDQQITHPTEVDYYLVSHSSIQGTARPTKYHLLYDDRNFQHFDLEMLTYYLCHMFARCTRSVSYPAPTYYAHLAAFRARVWWDGATLNKSQLRQEQEEKGEINSKILKNFPMFFV